MSREVANGFGSKLDDLMRGEEKGTFKLRYVGAGMWDDGDTDGDCSVNVGDDSRNGIEEGCRFDSEAGWGIVRVTRGSSSSSLSFSSAEVTSPESPSIPIPITILCDLERVIPRLTTHFQASHTVFHRTTNARTK